MANYTAADIKALREKTGAGMLDVKKALDEANGDQQKAMEIIRVKGLKGVTTETGAGQWGTALSMACSFFDLDCKVYMVKVSYEQKPSLLPA